MGDGSRLIVGPTWPQGALVLADADCECDEYVEETGIVLSDGGMQTGVYNPMARERG